MCLIPEVEYVYGNTCKPKLPNVFNYVKDGERLRAYIQVRNTGNIPAVDTILTARWCISSKSPTAPPTFKDCSNPQQSQGPWTDGPRILFHGGGDSTLDVTGTFSITKDAARAIDNKEMWFYYIGMVTYNRKEGSVGQPPPYRTDFCIYYDARGHGEDFSLYYCPQGNAAR